MRQGLVYAIVGVLLATWGVLSIAHTSTSPHTTAQRAWATAHRSGVGIDSGGATCLAQALDCDTTVAALLEESDCDFEDGTPLDVWELEGGIGQQVTLILTSAEFDAFLFLIDPLGDIVATDDNGAGGNDARIDFTLDRHGTWSVWANTLDTGGHGSYELSLSCGGELPAGCVGRSPTLFLHDGRFEVSGAAFLQGNPSTFFLQNICSPEGVSRTAAAFFFNAGNEPVQEGFLSIRDECPVAWKIEIASASTRRFWVDVLDTESGLAQRFENPNGGSSSFFPADASSFAASCTAP